MRLRLVPSPNSQSKRTRLPSGSLLPDGLKLTAAPKTVLVLPGTNDAIGGALVLSSVIRDTTVLTAPLASSAVKLTSKLPVLA